MRDILKTLAALCAVLFVMLAVPVLLLFNIERKAFSAATYKQAFEDQGLYERMPALLASTLQTMIAENPNAFPFLRELSGEDWQVTIISLLPPEEIRALTDSALESTFDYLNNRADSVVLSLRPVKARLSGESGVNVIVQFLKTQPDCTLEQLTQMGLGLLGGQIALCNPPEQAMGLVIPLIQSQLQMITTVFPDEIALIPGTESGTANDPRLRLNLARSVIRYSPLFVFLLLLVIFLFAVRSVKDFLFWWGIPVLIVGATSAVIGLIGAPIVGWFLQFLIQTQGVIFLPPLLASSLGETASAVARQMLIPVALQGTVLAVLALGMVILGILLARGQQNTMYDVH